MPCSCRAWRSTNGHTGAPPRLMWRKDGRLHVAYQATALARYAYRYARQAGRLCAIQDLRLHHTSYASSQLELWDLDDESWRKVFERPSSKRYLAQPPETSFQQLADP
jgi:hypothetical protein